MADHTIIIGVDHVTFLDIEACVIDCHHILDIALACVMECHLDIEACVMECHLDIEACVMKCHHTLDIEACVMECHHILDIEACVMECHLDIAVDCVMECHHNLHEETYDDSGHNDGIYKAPTKHFYSSSHLNKTLCTLFVREVVFFLDL